MTSRDDPFVSGGFVFRKDTVPFWAKPPSLAVARTLELMLCAMDRSNKGRHALRQTRPADGATPREAVLPWEVETMIHSWRGHSGARVYYLLPRTTAVVSCMGHLNLASTKPAADRSTAMVEPAPA